MARKSIFSAIILGILVILLSTLIFFLFELNQNKILIVGWAMTIIYAIIMIIIILKSNSRIIIKKVPIEKKVYIEKPVIKEVLVEKPRKKLNIPKYDFVGSTQTKTYHTRNCRLGKLIKRKYKLSSNSENDFKKKKFSPCKVCIKTK